MRTRIVAVAGVAAGLFLGASALASQPVLIEYRGTGTDHLGAAVAFGDVNGDGTPDILVGADVGGYVDVYDGASPTTRLYRLTGRAAGDAFGSTIATGDLTGDGRADVAVGAYSWD